MEYYASLESLQGKYGLLDSFNMGVTEEASSAIIRPERPIPVGGWFATDVIGIDKGISLLMIENYRSEFVWYYFMQSNIIKKGLEELEFTFR
ncbi:MAG: glucoamylase family protein, partial [Candidatus Izemoplasmatales bacterium]